MMTSKRKNIVSMLLIYTILILASLMVIIPMLWMLSTSIKTMEEICVIYASEDETIVGKLVALLRNHWNVWWAKDIATGDWEYIIRSHISESKAVVPVFSHNTEKKRIFKDELKCAENNGRLIFPFFIDHTEPPLGFGGLNRTDAFNWKGESN